MFIIAEKINSSRTPVHEAIERRDAAFIQKLAKVQATAGADAIDINAGTFAGREGERLCWLADVVEEACALPLCVDTADASALEKVLSSRREPGRHLVNSISAQQARWSSFLPLLKDYGNDVIVAAMDDQGIPETAQGRLRMTEKLVGDLGAEGVKAERLRVDPLICPVSTGDDMGVTSLRAIALIHGHFPEVHFACGLSNISFGLPVRPLLNRTFLVLAMGLGLDGAIMDPTDRALMAALQTAETLLGQDAYCADFLSAYREQALS